MKILPIYAEIASDDQAEQVERSIRLILPPVRFVTGEKMEGITLEEVEEKLNGKT